MKCLVMGASAFLGRAIVTRLAPEQCISRTFGQNAPQVVVYAAANPDPDFAEDNPAENHYINVSPSHVLSETLPISTYLILNIIERGIMGPIHFCSEKGSTRDKAALEAGKVLGELIDHLTPSLT